MTASTTRSCKRHGARRRALLFLIGLAGLPGAAHAEGIVVRVAELEAADEGYHLNADFDIDFNPVVEDALTHGIPLNFLLELEVWRPRAWWFNESLVTLQETRKLSYNPLTRQYRLSLGSVYQNFTNLRETLQVLSHIRSAPLVDVAALHKGQRYEASLRFSLDVAQLPKPFQIDALASRDWQLSSALYRWSFSP